MSNNAIDFRYKLIGYHYSIMPMTPQAESIYGDIVKQNNGSPDIFITHWPTFVDALRKAGYTFRKGFPKVKATDEELLAELGL